MELDSRAKDRRGGELTRSLRWPACDLEVGKTGEAEKEASCDIPIHYSLFFI